MSLKGLFKRATGLFISGAGAVATVCGLAAAFTIAAFPPAAASIAMLDVTLLAASAGLSAISTYGGFKLLTGDKEANKVSGAVIAGTGAVSGITNLFLMATSAAEITSLGTGFALAVGTLGLAVPFLYIAAGTSLFRGSSAAEPQAAPA